VSITTPAIATNNTVNNDAMRLATSDQTQVIDTCNGCVSVRTDKNVYVNVTENIVEQKYIRNSVGTGGVSCILPGSGIAVSGNTGSVTICATSAGANPATPTTLGTVYGYTTSGYGNTYIGQNAGTTTGIGYANVALGSGALACNQCGCQNVAIGCNALTNNVQGDLNTAIGTMALHNNTAGSFNIAVGFYSMASNICGSRNIAQGYRSLHFNTTGYGNIGLGHHSLYYNNARNNIAIGSSSMYNTSTGESNVAVGVSSLQTNTTGCRNVAQGYMALSNSNGNFNIGVGAGAGRCITTGTNNTVIGTLYGTAGLTCTLLLGAGTCERVKVDNTGLYVNGTLFSGGGGSPATPTSLGTVHYGCGIKQCKYWISFIK
jgi:hypothetical protein